MFSLSSWKLIRLENDGSDGRIIQTQQPILRIGSAPHNDYELDDCGPDAHFEISTDNYGRVSNFSSQLIALCCCE